MNKITASIFILSLFIIGLLPVSASTQELQIIDSLRQHNLSEANLKIVVDNNNEIAYSFGAINIDSSLVYSNKAMILATEINYTYGLALAYSYTARAMMEKDMFRNAIEQYNKSLNLFIELEDSINILDCYRGLAYVYSYGAGEMKSLEYDFKALKIAEQLQDSLSLSTIYNNIGTIYTHLENYDAAIVYYGKSIAIDQECQNYANLATSHSNIGTLKLENNKLEAAATNFNTVLSLLPRVNNPYTNSYLYLSLSSYYTELCQYDSAKYYINLTNDLLSEYPYQHIQARSLRKEGELLFKQKHYRQAIVFFEKCLELSKSIGIDENFPKMYRMKGEAYSHLKMYEEAYQFSHLANSTIDSLQNEKSFNFLNEFEKEQRIKESERQALEQKLNDQETENIRIRLKFKFTIAIAVIVLLILIILGIIYSAFKIRHKNKTLKSQHKLIQTQKRMLEDHIQKLTLSKNSLKKLNATKDKFFSIIAHDLRSPFNSILGFSNLLIEDANKYDTATSEQFIRMINLSAKNTLILLDNLLQWAKSQSGKITYNPAKLDLEVIVLDIVDILTPSAKIKNISINHNKSIKVQVRADEEMLKTVLRNLISNGIKFSNTNGCIDIYTTQHQNSIDITISDNGVGISKETQDELFDIEQNNSTRGTDNETGTGLGLVLCKEFVEKLGGEISVKSEVGKGSKFTFSLPY